MSCKWFTSRFIRKRKKIDNAVDSSQRGPLDHPEVAAMTMRELADLPMPAYALEACASDARLT
jgi:hypothetical protein